MAHGGSEDTPESDLTPLLDLVLQVLMFFIINVQLATDQANPDVKLPLSESARPLDKPVAGDIILNQRKRSDAVLEKLTPSDKARLLNADSIIFVTNESPMSMLEVRAWLKDQYERAERRAPGKPVDVTIHFRPDGDLDVNELMKLMTAAKLANFKKIKMHAMKTGD